MAKEVQVIKASLQDDREKVLRVAAYCRVSTDSEDQINSFVAQVKYYNDYIRHNDQMTLVDIYADEGVTGTAIQKRDDFKRLINDCKNGKIDRVLVKSVTRFARNSLECIETVRKLKSYGTSIYFENDNIDTELMNSEMILYIKSAFAQGESMSASKRMSTSIRMRMENGSFTPTAVPYGYKANEGVWEIVPEEAEDIKEIFRLCLAGYGVNLILREMRNRSDRIVWTKGRVHYILSNEKYTGDCLFQKYFTPTVLPLKTHVNRGELPKYLYSSTHTAIISKDEFERVQVIMAERATKYNHGIRGDVDFFKGKIFCRQCGWVFRKIERKSGWVWMCSKKGHIDVVCHSASYTDEQIQRAFIKMYNSLKRNERVIVDETLSQFVALRKRINNGNNAISEIDIEIASLSEQNATYSKLYANQIINETIYFEKTDKIKRQITELRSRRLKLLNEDEDERCIEGIRELKRILDDNDYQQEMNFKLFEQIVEKVFAEQDGSLTFKLKCELELNVGGENGK